MRKRKRQGRAAVRSGSIRRRLLLMLMVLLLLQTAVYLLVFFKGGVQGEARKNAFSIFREQTANRALDLGNDMVERWSNTREGENDVYAAVGELLDEYGLTAEALLKDSVLCRQLVADTAEHVIAMLRRQRRHRGLSWYWTTRRRRADAPGFMCGITTRPAMPRATRICFWNGDCLRWHGRTAWRWTAIGALFLTWMMRLRRKTNIFLHRCRRLPQWSRRTAAGNTFTTGAAGSG